MADSDPQSPGWLQPLLTLVISAGTFSALAVFLGRLWTSSYYGYFGLPTSDLTLDAGDYAFRTKEVLVMLVLAGTVAVVIAWKARPLQKDAASFTTNWWWLGFSAPLAVMAMFISMAQRQWRWVESEWKLLALALGIAIGAAIGLSLATLRQRLSKSDDGTTGQGAQRASALVLAVLTVFFAVWFVPYSIVRLAQASAAADVRTQNLSQAVVEFDGKAPVSIRRADDSTLSIRGYLVLLTPERIALAFPYPCRQVQTQTQQQDEDTCDILSFKRNKVRSVRVFGNGGRTANDSTDRADTVLLKVAGNDLSPRTIVRQKFDFSSTRVTNRDCRGGTTIEDQHGVWFRLQASQAGRIQAVTSDKHSDFYLATSADQRACQKLDTRNGIRVNNNDDVLLFVSHPLTGETRGVVELQYAPLALQTNDCRIAVDPRQPTQRKVDCDDTNGLSFKFSVVTPSAISVSVDVMDTQGAVCAAGGVPRVFLADAELTADKCAASPGGSGQYSVSYLGGQPIGIGTWPLLVCQPAGGSAKVTAAQATPSSVVSQSSQGAATPPAVGPPVAEPGTSTSTACPS